MFEFDYYQFLLLILILTISFLVFLIVGCKKVSEVKIIIMLFLWHSFFSFCYFAFTLYNSADAVKYYRVSLTESFTLYPGSPFVYSFSSIFSQGIKANYLNTTLCFGFFGSLGLILLYLSLKDYFKKIPAFWVLLLFIPSMSFWSSGLGKDAISFFSVCLFLYSITNNKKLYILLPISFFFMFMVRPHIALMMIVSFVIYFIIKSKVHLLFKFMTLPIIIAGVIYSSSFVQQYVGLDEASVESISTYVDARQSSNLEGGSSIDLQSMSYPVQVFTYIFRPLPFDANSALALFTSIENTILLILFLYVLFKNKFRLNYFIEGKNTWLLIYAFLTCSMLAITTANLGIATRQKWMFMPILIYLLVYTFYQFKESQRIGRLRK